MDRPRHLRAAPLLALLAVSFALFLWACSGSGAAEASAEAAGSEGSGPAVSAERRFFVDIVEDVVYGRALRRDSPEDADWTEVELTLDVYRPRGAVGPRPALVCVHGGGFAGRVAEPAEGVTYAAASLLPFVKYFATRGFVVFTPRYRLAEDHGAVPPGFPPPPEGFDPTWYGAMYPAVRDVKAALRWIHANADAYAIDEDRIALLGGSAGGAISVALGVSDPEDFTTTLPPSEDPTLESTNLGARSDASVVVAFWGNHVPVDALRRYDGRSRFDAGDAAVAIFHGRQDDVSPLADGIALRDELAAAGIPHVFRPFDGVHAAWDATIDGKGLPELAFEFVVAHQDLQLR